MLANGSILQDKLLSIFENIDLSPYRLLLDTGNVQATVPMIRGVWGSALNGLDKRAYERVFEGKKAGSPSGIEKTPLYIFSPTPPDPDFSPAVDWTIIGAAHDHENTLILALNKASQMGLGPKRIPFSIPTIVWLTKHAITSPEKQRWTLREAAESALGKYSFTTNIQIHFSSPLRLMRDKKLITQPSFADIAIAISRRVFTLANIPQNNERSELLREIKKIAYETKSIQWKGERVDFVRWSGSQKQEIDLRGITGSFELPNGVGELWPLLIAGQWLHIGKGTVFGLGKMQVILSM